MSRKHQSKPTDHPTHPVKGPDEVNEGQVRKSNGDQTGGLSKDDRMVEIGRGENTAGRQGS